ncbi:MAG: hypothetical protein QM811_19700 [Pirellulales bacterium]
MSLPRTKVVIEVPDAFDPSMADQKYVVPLRRLLTDNDAGVILEVAQGPADTPDEFTRMITVELARLDLGLDIIGEFLAENAAPAGTLACVYDANGNIVDRFMLS